MAQADATLKRRSTSTPKPPTSLFRWHTHTHTRTSLSASSSSSCGDWQTTTSHSCCRSLPHSALPMAHSPPVFLFLFHCACCFCHRRALHFYIFAAKVLPAICDIQPATHWPPLQFPQVADFFPLLFGDYVLGVCWCVFRCVCVSVRVWFAVGRGGGPAYNYNGTCLLYLFRCRRCFCTCSWSFSYSVSISTFAVPTATPPPFYVLKLFRPFLFCASQPPFLFLLLLYLPLYFCMFLRRRRRRPQLLCHCACVRACELEL